MTSDDELLFHRFVGCINVFFWKESVHSFCPLFDVFCFVLFFSWKFVWVLCRFWILAFCQMNRLKKIVSNLLVSRSLYWNFLLLRRSSCLIRSPLYIFAFLAIAFGVLVMKSLPMPMSWIVLPGFSPRVFMVLGLMFKSLIHL